MIRQNRSYALPTLLTALVCSTLLCLCQAKSDGEPTALELEVWRAATTIDTSAAYTDYLAKFPNGFFAAMASAALRKLAPSPPKPSQSRLSTDALRHVDAETGAVTFQPGDRFYGPGVVRSGWFGAKRQIALPSGEWIVLAAFDHYVESFTRVQLTSVAFGRFHDERLETIVAFVSNSRSFPQNPGTVGANPVPIGMAERCDLNSESAVSETTSTPREQSCMSVQRHHNADLRALLPGQLGGRVESALESLHTKATGPVTRSVIEVLAPASHYAAYIRIDCDDAQDLRSRTEAFRRFRPAALTGIGYRFDLEDLRPGLRASSDDLKFGD